MTVETVDGGGLPIVKSGPYSGNGVTTAFDYDFQIQAETELLLTRQNADLTEDTLVLTTDYTVSGVGSDTGGTITLVDAATDLPTGTKLVITYLGAFDQSTDYSNQGRIQLALLESALDKLTMHLRGLKEIADRAVTVDSFGTVDVTTLRANITALAAIESDISTVAGLATEVAALDAISADITAVAAVAADVDALGAITADITAAVAIDTEITTVAGIAAAVSTVAAIAANVTTVAGISANVTTVAGISANVTAVAGISADVTRISDIYVGASASAPTTRLNGDPLEVGDFYLNTSGTPQVNFVVSVGPVAFEAITVPPTQSDATWEAGVSVVESLISPAKLKIAKDITTTAGAVDLDTLVATDDSVETFRLTAVPSANGYNGAGVGDWLTSFTYSATAGRQIAQNWSAGDNPRMYIRDKISGTWGDWIAVGELAIGQSAILGADPATPTWIKQAGAYLKTDYPTLGAMTEFTGRGMVGWREVPTTATPSGTNISVGNGCCWVSTSTVIVVGSSGTGARSTNGGSTWTALTMNVATTAINAVAYDGGTDLVAVCSAGKITYSTDSGATWTQAAGTGATTFNDVVWHAAGSVWLAVRTDGEVWSSADGISWSSLIAGTGANGLPAGAINSIASEGTTVMAANQDGTMSRSTNSGASWTFSTIDSDFVVEPSKGVAGDGNSNWIVARDDGQVLLSTDDGVNFDTDISHNVGASKRPVSGVAIDDTTPFNTVTNAGGVWMIGGNTGFLAASRGGPYGPWYQPYDWVDKGAGTVNTVAGSTAGAFILTGSGTHAVAFNDGTEFYVGERQATPPVYLYTGET